MCRVSYVYIYYLIIYHIQRKDIFIFNNNHNNSVMSILCESWCGR